MSNGQQMRTIELETWVPSAAKALITRGVSERAPFCASIGQLENQSGFQLNSPEAKS